MVEWERIPDGVPEDFQALDGDEIVGRVYQNPTGPERGLWFWTMTVVRPGPRITFPRSGTEARRGDAGRRVVEAYERLLAHARNTPPEFDKRTFMELGGTRFPPGPSFRGSLTRPEDDRVRGQDGIGRQERRNVGVSLWIQPLVCKSDRLCALAKGMRLGGTNRQVLKKPAEGRPCHSLFSIPAPERRPLLRFLASRKVSSVRDAGFCVNLTASPNSRSSQATARRRLSGRRSS
jgi:hypothetical protein